KLVTNSPIARQSMAAYLQATDIINWHHPSIQDQAKRLAIGCKTPNDIARVCFYWVRDKIRHSVDYQLNPVTCRASDVLHHRTGYCYAKSHLLAALLRANHIPAGLCYQRLSINAQGAPYCLHGLTAIYLPGWYRVDPRGNRDRINAQFTPPQEQLAFSLHIPGETDLPGIFADPLDVVVQALQSHTTWDDLLKNLPDMSLEDAKTPL
ncbi:MAG: transglutaminase family protein, partial [Cyanobacteria bacterium P01_D01_bin.2]